MVEAIEEGKMNASKAQNPYDIGYLSVNRQKEQLMETKLKKEL
jgi:ABC-type sugar transport system substrate-binding protein